jgi:cytochrome b561
MHQLQRFAGSRFALVLAITLAVSVPAATLPRLPHVTLWPVLLGMIPWVFGKYVLCPLRWHALTGSSLSRWWHIRAYAEADLLGLLTPGYVGSDLWRIRRLTRGGVSGPDALASVGLDRFVGAVGLTVFVVFAGTALPIRMLVVAIGVGALAVAVALLLRRLRPELLPRRVMPPPRQLASALVLAALYQLTIAALLLGALSSTGHPLPPLALLGAFGASQLAGAVPGPHGASPRDAAFVLALVALGVPWAAAAGAVTLKATLAWAPALSLGGLSLLATRRAFRCAPVPVT